MNTNISCFIAVAYKTLELTAYSFFIFKICYFCSLYTHCSEIERRTTFL